MDETVVGSVKARRKGRDQKPCEVVVGYDEGEGVVVLRTEDKSGVPPIVIVLSASDAKQVAEFLTRASTNASPWGK